jgi:cyclopropane fatty-acyl-phospholipid synthase-like methyltransferase
MWMHSEADKIIPLYRRHALAWAARRRSLAMERGWLEKFAAVLPSGPTVLDIGCGSGEPMGRYFLEAGACVTGIDASPEIIEIAQQRQAEGEWIVADMRDLRLDRKFDGILAWHSAFHLTQEDQRKMFPIYQRHAADGAVMMFTSGPSHGEAIGELEGEALYHSSLDPEEYRALLDQNGFQVLEHVVEDPECGFATIWLAQFQGIVGVL